MENLMDKLMFSIKRPYEEYKKDYKNFIIGALLSVVPIANLIPLGYQLNCGLRRKRMPRFEDYGSLFRTGFFAFLANLVWAIPSIICLLIIIAIIGFKIIGLIMTGSEVTSKMLSSAFDLPTIIVLIVLFLLLMLLSIILGYLSPIIMLRAAKSGFKAGLEVKEVFGRALTVNWLKTYLAMLLATIIISVAVMMVFSIISLPLTLLGQIPIIGIPFSMLDFILSISIQGALAFALGIMTYTFFGFEVDE